MTANEAKLPVTVLCELLRLDQEVGRLYWRERTPAHFGGTKYSPERTAKTWNKKFAGKEALAAIHSKGYRQGTIINRHFYAHRVVFALYNGCWPSEEVDHINGNPADNRPSNLRCVTRAENAQNMSTHSDNSCGHMGVYKCKRRGKWMAQIYVKGRHIHLGQFDDIDQALQARKQANEKFGYHPNHGRTA